MLLTIFAIEVSPQFKLILTTKGRTGQNASGHEASCPRVPSGLSINWMNEELKRFNILDWSTITSDASDTVQSTVVGKQRAAHSDACACSHDSNVNRAGECRLDFAGKWSCQRKHSHF